MKCLSPMWHSKPETSRRVQQRIGAIMKWAIAEGFLESDPSAAILAGLGKNSTRRSHRRALHHSHADTAHGLTDTQVSGSYRYRPYDPMLRSEMALFLQKAFRLPLSDEASASSFQDIPADATYAAAAEAVREAGITRGCGVDPLHYCPDDTVKRDTMAAFLARALRTSDLRRVLALAPGRETLRAAQSGPTRGRCGSARTLPSEKIPWSI